MRAQRAPRGPVTDRLLGAVDPAVTQESLQLPTRSGSVRVLVHRPPQAGAAAPVVVHLHGGGWCIGDAEQSAPICSQLAAATDCAVVSVDYRLAPEHPFPAAVDDAEDAVRAVLSGAVPGTDPRRVAVMGDSAGANLATVAARRLGRAGGSQPLLQVLLYPAVDARSPGSPEPYLETPLLRRRDAEAFRELYLAGHDPADPDVSPLLAPDLARLPPALVITAERDPLRRAGTEYAERLAAAGVAVRHTDYAGMPHGFVSLPGVCRSAAQAKHEIVLALRSALQS